MASIYQRGKSWYIQWREKDGELKRKSLGAISQPQAEAKLTALEASLSTDSIPAAGPRFLDWAVEYSHWHASEYPASYDRVEQILRVHLIPTFGDMPIGALSRREVERYKQSRVADGAAIGTVTKELRTLQAAINKAVEWELIPHSPIKGVKPPRDLNSKPPQWYTKKELQAIYKEELDIKISTSKPNAALHNKYKWIWQLMANTGLRRTEALQLKWKNIGQEEIRVISDGEARTKSGKWRQIPIAPNAQEALEALKGELFVLPRVRRESLSRSFIRTANNAGVGGSMHSLRHTYCSHLVMGGIPLRTVQMLAGHASYSTTERYAHLAPGHLRESIKVLEL